MNDIFSKLNNLKSIEPSESWVVESRREVLSKTPVFCDLEHEYDEKSSSYFNLRNLFANKLAFSAFSMMLVLFGGIYTVNASKSSLPGDLFYPIKMAGENMELAVASEDNKAEIEIKQVGKRVEELAKVSQNHSDINQTEKVVKLLEEIEVKSKNANSHLANLNNKEKVTTVAKIANEQSGKYAEVLTKTAEELPASIKNDVSVEVEKALDSNKKLNFDSLAAMIDGITDDNKEEILKKINNEISQIESEIKILEIEPVLSDAQIILLDEAKEEIEKAKQSLEGDSLLDVMNGVAAVQEIIVKFKNGEKKDISVEAVEDIEDVVNDNSGSVSGDSDDRTNLKEETDESESAEESVADEIQEAVIKTENGEEAEE